MAKWNEKCGFHNLNSQLRIEIYTIIYISLQIYQLAYSFFDKQLKYRKVHCAEMHCQDLYLYVNMHYTLVYYPLLL